MHGNRRRWKASEIALLGRISDARIAELLGLSRRTVLVERQRRGIEPAHPQHRPVKKRYRGYLVIIHKDADSDYGVTVPELLGCFSVGKTLEEALRMAHEAVELHLQGLTEAGEPIPAPHEIDH
jgi:predicted RNase H-like HicB family nuclease